MTRARAGVSLVEVMVVVTISGILMGSVGVCLHGMHRASQHSREAVERLDTISRLSLRFREDAHTAKTAATHSSQDGECLALLIPDGRTIRYQVRPQAIERTVWRDGEMKHRDGFRLPRGATARWRIENHETPLVTMEIDRPIRGAQAASLGPDRIEAAVQGVIVLRPVAEGTRDEPQTPAAGDIGNDALLDPPAASAVDSREDEPQ